MEGAPMETHIMFFHRESILEAFMETGAILILLIEEFFSLIRLNAYGTMFRFDDGL